MDPQNFLRFIGGAALASVIFLPFSWLNLVVLCYVVLVSLGKTESPYSQISQRNLS